LPEPARESQNPDGLYADVGQVWRDGLGFVAFVIADAETRHDRRAVDREVLGEFVIPRVCLVGGHGCRVSV
jgi:hypothetical protein